MGVYPLEVPRKKLSSCFPHARGGVPTLVNKETEDKVVFPTHVGVYRKPFVAQSLLVRFPHARGGVPSHQKGGEP